MDIMIHAKFHFNQLMLTLISGVWASEPPLGPGEPLKRPGLIGLIMLICTVADSHIIIYHMPMEKEN